MNKEDYSKYYIQGSDHYLIPKDEFKELFNEMSNWREEAKELKKQLENYKKLGFKHLQDQNVELNKKYENAVADYETTMAEKEQLNSLVNSCQEEIRELKKQLTTYKILHRDCKVDNLKNISKIEEMENQQKDFIKFLEDNYKEIQDIWYIKILQKYKEIIGDKQ